MIYIKEAPTKKMPGQTSLFVSFSYNSDIVEVLRNLPVRHYYKDTKEWEVPIVNLTYLIESLKKYDDIELELLNNRENKTNEPINIEEILNQYVFKTKPFPHQLDGIRYGLTHDSWILGDDQGLGKTFTIINLALIRKQFLGLKHCLIICGVNSIKDNWIEEIETHSNEKGYILGTRYRKNGKRYIGSVKDRIDDLENDIDAFFIITNIESLRDKKLVNQLVKRNDIDMCVIDEAHKSKSHTSLQGKGVQKLKNKKHKIPMSGTILLNSPLDAYAPLKWIGEENSNFGYFKGVYTIQDQYHRVIEYQNLELLRKSLERCMLRRKKSDVLDLPPKIYKNEYIELGDKQRELYDYIFEQSVAEYKNLKLKAKELDKVKLNGSYLSLLTRMRQVLGYTGILSNTIEESAKFDRLEDFIETIIAEGNKVIVVSNYKEVIKAAMERFKNLNYAVITGDVKEEDRHHEKNKLQHDDNCKVLFGTIQTMGVSLTLTAASYIIFLDEAWTKGEMEQAADRIYRMGTTKTVFVYRFIAKDTIDEKIHEHVERKGLITDYLVDGKVDNESLEEILDYLLLK